MSAHEIVEQIEHAAHGEGGGHGRKLGTYVGITMAVLGVLLAFCAARVGAERTELVESMVDQQHAHAKYQAQDIKHRVAVIALQQLHATMFAEDAAGAAPKAEAQPKAEGEQPAAPKRDEGAAGAHAVPNKVDVVAMAHTAERYLKESRAANEWVEAFDPAIKAHVEAQEQFERAQLLAEIGIVVASIALLLHRKGPWFLAILLGIGALSVVGLTFVRIGGIVHDAEHRIEEKSKEYRELRNADKTTDAENKLVAEMLTWAGSAETPNAAEPAQH